MTAGFREVLHAWALDQLNAGAKDHTGPFEVVSVKLQQHDEYDADSLVCNQRVDVNIEFEHRGCTAYTWDGHPECTVRWWSPLSGTENTVTLLNQLLAKGDAA